MHTVPEACLLYAPGAVCFSNRLLEYSSRLLKVQDHMVLMVQDHMVLDHKSRPKSPKSASKGRLNFCESKKVAVNKAAGIFCRK